MKKTIIVSLAFIGCTAALSAQSIPEKEETPSLIERIFKPDNDSKKFQLFLHTKGSFNAEMPNGKFEEAKFRMDQLRIEMRGDINKNIYYRYQQRLTAFPDPSGTFDNLPLKIDYAGVGYRFNEKWRLFAGKMCTAYGGIEFDDNPINVYQYSTIHENMIAFLTGIDIGYHLTPDHEFRFQILDARNESMEKTYGKIPEYIKPSKLDLVYTLNWNGYMGPNRMFATRWSASVLNEAKGKNMYYGVLGTAMNTGKFGMFLDLMYSREELDRKQMISRIVADKTNGFTQTSVDYSSVILGLNYRFAPKWNIFAKGIWDTASKYEATGIVEKGLYQTAWGYSGGIEFYPIKNDNLHVNLVYTGRQFNYTNRAKAFGATDYSHNKLELSFIYAMRLF
ncbi:MAG: porin [Bacteroidales bacterium]